MIPGRECQAMQGRAVWAGAWNSWHHNQAFYYGLRSIPIAQHGTALPEGNSVTDMRSG